MDVKNLAEVDKLVSDHEHIISFIPPWMHTPIAAACVKLGKNFISSSYISPDMEKMHADVKAKGLIFLNECGLDPGIDIMGTMKIVHEAEKCGYKVVSYESYCGGIPVAEQADNPLGYKFSWNPGAGIKASRNTAIFKKDGKRVVTDTPLKCAEHREDFSVSMKLESYPNRDSTVFMERFGMQECETFVRGTLRFTGFSSIISAFHDIGLTSDDLAHESVTNLRTLLESRLAGVHKNNSSGGAGSQALIDAAVSSLLTEDHDQRLMKQALARVDLSFLPDAEKLNQGIRGIIKTMIFLGFFDDSQKVSSKDKSGKGRPCLDVLGDVMAVKLGMNDQDRDLVVMRHIFHLLDPATNHRWEHTSTMVASGKSKADKGETIMSQSVGITTALATRLVLEGRISGRGVLSPMTPEIYSPILAQLEKKGIYMVEESANPKAHARMAASSQQAKM